MYLLRLLRAADGLRVASDGFVRPMILLRSVVRI